MVEWEAEVARNQTEAESWMVQMIKEGRESKFFLTWKVLFAIVKDFLVKGKGGQKP